MAGRAKPNWGVFIGGPLDGERRVLDPDLREGAYVARTKGSAPGMQVAHEYTVTSVYRKGGFHESKAREVRFVRTLPGEQPAPPLPSTTMSVWASDIYRPV